MADEQYPVCPDCGERHAPLDERLMQMTALYAAALLQEPVQIRKRLLSYLIDRTLPEEQPTAGVDLSSIIPAGQA